MQAKVNELEEEIAKTLQHFEQSNTDIQAHLKLFYINSAENVEYTAADGTKSQYLLVKLPFRSLGAFRKVGKQVIDHLEAKFKWPVVLAANRTIISTRGKYWKIICFNALYSVSNNFLAIHHASQKRPRSRTLKAVHQALLDDIVAPSAITGRTVRVATNGKRTEKIFLDPLDRELMEPRLEAMSHAYAKLTTHNVVFDFSKPTAF